MTAKDRLILNNNSEIPIIGFGCWNAYGDEIASAVSTAINSGYRYIDSASRYQNETDVGRGIRNSDIQRDQLYILSKLWPLDFDSPCSALDKTLYDLGIDYLDTYLIHWPGSDVSRRHRAIEMLLPHQGKKFNYLAVSNFQIEHLIEFHDTFGFYPAINQIELHPFYQQHELSAFCIKHNIALVAWGPLYRARAMDDEIILSLAEEYNKTPAQILIRWHLQKGHIPIPKSKSPARISENISVFDFSLSDASIAKLDTLNSDNHIGANPYTYNGEIKK